MYDAKKHLRWRIVVEPFEDPETGPYWFATVPELGRCSANAVGDTPEEAIGILRSIVEDIVVSCNEKDMKIPEPDFDEYRALSFLCPTEFEIENAHTLKDLMDANEKGSRPRITVARRNALIREHEKNVFSFPWEIRKGDEVFDKTSKTFVRRDLPGADTLFRSVGEAYAFWENNAKGRERS